MGPNLRNQMREDISRRYNATQLKSSQRYLNER